MFYKGSITDALHQSNRTFFPLLIFIVDPTSPQQQLPAVEALIRSASLRSCAILHLLLVGTPEFAQFMAASNMKENNNNTATPRVCIFPPATRGLPPYVLAGEEQFTAEKVSEAVAVGMMLQETTLKEASSIDCTMRSWIKRSERRPCFGRLCHKPMPSSNRPRRTRTQGPTAARAEVPAAPPTAAPPRTSTTTHCESRGCQQQ